MYLLVHTCEVKLKGWQRSKIDKIQTDHRESEEKKLYGDPETCLSERSPDSSHGTESSGVDLDSEEKNSIMNKGFENFSSAEGYMANSEFPIRKHEEVLEETHPGVHWDVFRRQDVPKLTEYLKMHQKEFGKQNDEENEPVSLSVKFIFLPHFLVCFGLFASFVSECCSSL